MTPPKKIPTFWECYASLFKPDDMEIAEELTIESFSLTFLKFENIHCHIYIQSIIHALGTTSDPIDIKFKKSKISAFTSIKVNAIAFLNQIKKY